MTTVDALPNRRVEGWRWSDIRSAVGLELPPVAPRPKKAAPATEQFASLDPIELVIEDGRIVLWPEAKRAHAPLVFSKKTSEADAPINVSSSPLAGLAVADMADDWFPIIQSHGNGGVVLLRHIARAGPFSRQSRIGVSVRPEEDLTLIEVFEGSHIGFTNTLSECFIGKGATLTRIVLQPAAPEANIVCTSDVSLGEEARYRQFALVEGGKLVRVDTGVATQAKANVQLAGVYLAGAGRHADLTSHVRLEAEGAEVRQLVRGVARKGGRGVFQGKFKVERAAQKTDAEMQHNALMLEEGAEIFAKPELEIYADDVKCSHGNTAGQLDEGAIFYLRSRGIPEAEARAMITRAFLLEALPDWLEGDVRAGIEARIDAWLGAGHG